MSVINVISLNVRGLRDENKRRDIFQHYRARCDVLCLQETHSDVESSAVWANEWGSRQIVLSHGTSQSRGVGIFINPKTKCVVKQKHMDEEGRFAYVVLEVAETKICVASIYGPNKDSPIYIENLLRQSYMVCDNLVVTGDFNTVLNPLLDKNNPSGAYNRKTSERLCSLIDEMKLSDVWRMRNPEKKRYSWYRTGLRQYSRICHVLGTLLYLCFLLRRKEMIGTNSKLGNE